LQVVILPSLHFPFAIKMIYWCPII
jgi:hypothetical protein